MEAPSGGPKDEDPPEVTGILPADGSTRVDRNSSLQISFSEKIDGDSFKKLVSVYPPLEYDRISAKNNVLEIRFKEEMPETTICVVIGRGYTDYHNVKGEKEIEFCFSTTDSLDSGSISGRVLFKMSPDSTGLIKLVAVSAVDSTGDVKRAQESRVAFSRRDGSFNFRSLPAEGTPFLLWAFIDRNRDSRFSPNDEFSSVLEDTFTLTSQAPAIGNIMINIIDPNEPGRVEGSIVDLTESKVSPTARFEPVSEDLNPLVAVADSSGYFIFAAVPPGDYIYTAFIDFQADSLPGNYPDPADSTVSLDEYFTIWPDTLTVEPGSELVLEPIYIEKGKGGNE
jgi:hypothetical protein